jgi:hypothetical protein
MGNVLRRVLYSKWSVVKDEGFPQAAGEGERAELSDAAGRPPVNLHFKIE